MITAAVAFAAPAGAQSAAYATAPAPTTGVMTSNRATPSPIRTSPSLIPDAMCNVNYYVQSQASRTFTALVSFSNPTSGTIAAPWTLSWAYSDGQVVTGISGGPTYSQTGNRVTATGPAGDSVPPGGSRSFTITGTWNGYQNTAPGGFTLKPPPNVYFFGCSVTTKDPAATVVPPPVTSPVVTTQPVSTPPVYSSPLVYRCTIDYTIGSQWPYGFSTTVVGINRGEQVTSWTVRFTLPDGQTITQLWGAWDQSVGSSVVVSNATWNGTIATNGTARFGFNGAWNNVSNREPLSATLNGAPCNVT